MDAATSIAEARCAPTSVLAAANRFVSVLELEGELLSVCDAVVFHSQPEWASAFLRKFLVSCFDHGLDAFASETIVAEVDLLDVFAMLKDIRQLLHALVVYLIVEELQNAKVRAAAAEVHNLAKT